MAALVVAAGARQRPRRHLLHRRLLLLQQHQHLHVSLPTAATGRRAGTGTRIVGTGTRTAVARSGERRAGVLRAGRVWSWLSLHAPRHFAAVLQKMYGFAGQLSVG